MKKIIQLSLAVLALTFILQACSTTRALTGADKGKVNGNWTLTNVSYEGIIANAVQDVFNQAPPASFVNSTWVLSNSGNGSYTLANGTSQTIFWSYNNQDKTNPLFQFKKIYQGDKAKDVAEGYILNVAQVDDAAMILKSPVPVGNKIGYVVYTFSKK